MKTTISVIMNVPLPWVGRSRVCFCFFTKIIFKLTIDISMRKIIWKMEYFINSMIYQMLKFFKRITSFYPHMILRPKFCLEADTKNTGLLIFKSLKQKKLLFNFFVNRNWKKLTDNRKSHHPTETHAHAVAGHSPCKLSLSFLKACTHHAVYLVYLSTSINILF